MLTALLPLLLLASPASAQESKTRVFVAPFEARTREATSIASLMAGFLQTQLDAREELDAIGIDEVGPVFDTNAQTYMASCPTGELVGCAFVVGEVARAEFAITGTVDSAGGASRVEVSIIDILESREVISFQADLAVGDDAVFAEGVARVLVAVVRGEAGRSDDIRTDEDAGAREAEIQRAAEIAAQLDQLSSELGDVTTLTTRSEMEIERPRYTVGEISEQMESEGTKPWERLGMGPREYMRYRNSEMSLPVWRQRAMGRQGQLIARVGPSLGTSQSHGAYYGVYARSSQTLSVIDAYSYQAVTSGSSVGGTASLSYGLLPFLEVGVLAGLGSGRYSLLIDSYVAGDTRTLRDAEDRTNQVIIVGPQVLASFMHTSFIRPVIGGEATALIGTTVSSRYSPLPAQELSAFSTPVLWRIGARVGGELRLSDNIDIFAHLPFGSVIAGSSSETQRVGDAGLDASHITSPPGLSPIYAGVDFGLQARIGGKKVKSGPGGRGGELL